MLTFSSPWMINTLSCETYGVLSHAIIHNINGFHEFASGLSLFRIKHFHLFIR